MNINCGNNGCPVILSSSCVFYEGPTLSYTGINTNDSVQTVIQKLNTIIEEIGESGGGGGDAIWGSITGTITNQTDLINYLAANYLSQAMAASTYTPLGRTITINGVTQSLAADRTYTITVIGTASNISVSGGATDTPIIDLINTAVTPASYTVNGGALFTVDTKGRLTSASNVVVTTTGTTDRISVSGGSGLTPTIDIAATYIGQASITTLGTITTGTWTADVIGSSYGGAGSVNGILKANGSGVVSAAVAGTDYLAPGDTSVWLAASGVAITANNTISGAFNVGFTNTSVGIGVAPASITANTRLDLRGSGTPTNLILRGADGANTLRFSVLENGTFRAVSDASNPFRWSTSTSTNYVEMAPGTSSAVLFANPFGSASIGIHSGAANLINVNVGIQMNGSLRFTNVAATDASAPRIGRIAGSSGQSGILFDVLTIAGTGTDNYFRFAVSRTMNNVNITSTIIDVPSTNTFNDGGFTGNILQGINYNPTITGSNWTHYATRFTSGMHFIGNHGTTIPTTPANGILFYAEDVSSSSKPFIKDEAGNTGRIIPKLVGTGTLNFGDTVGGDYEDLTITVTGAVSGDAVELGVPNGSVTDYAIFWAWVSAADTVTVRFYNGDTLNQNPASGTFTAIVSKI